MDDAIVAIGADLSELRRQLALMPNLAGDAGQKMLVKLERAVSRTEKEAKRAAKAVERAAKDGKKAAEKAAAETRKGLLELVDLAGGPADGIRKLGEGMAALASPAGIAAVAVGGTALALAGLAAGITAAVLKADDLAKELKGLRGTEGFEGLPPAAAKSIENANSAVAALGAIFKQVVVTAGAEFAPVVEKVATLLVKLGLMALDAFQKFSDGHSVLRELAVFLVERMVKAFLGPIDGLVNLIGLMGDLAEVAGATGLGKSLQALEEKWDGFTRSVAETAVDFYFDAATGAVEDLDAATSDYDARAGQLIGTMGKLANQTKETKKEVDKLKEALKDWALIFDNETAPAVDRTRDGLAELALEVDKAVPPKALSKFDQLNLLLLQLQVEASKSAEAAKALAEPIERIQTEIQDLSKSGWAQWVKDMQAGLGDVQKGLEEAGQAMEAAAGAEKISIKLQTAADKAKELASAAGDIFSAITGGADFSIGSMLQAAGEATGKKAARAYINELVDNAVLFMQRLAENLPVLIRSFSKRIPDIIDAVIEHLPKIVGALVKGTISLLLEHLPRLAVGLGRAIIESIWEAIKAIGRAIRDFFTLGDGKGKKKKDGGGFLRNLFNDTPGVVRAGLSGMQAAFSSLDYVAADTSLEGLGRQVDAARGRAGAPGAMARVVIDWRDGHLGLDRSFLRSLESGALRQAQPAQSGQREVYP